MRGGGEREGRWKRRHSQSRMGTCSGGAAGAGGGATLPGWVVKTTLVCAFVVAVWFSVSHVPPPPARQHSREAGGGGGGWTEEGGTQGRGGGGGPYTLIEYLDQVAKKNEEKEMMARAEPSAEILVQAPVVTQDEDGRLVSRPRKGEGSEEEERTNNLTLYWLDQIAEHIGNCIKKIAKSDSDVLFTSKVDNDWNVVFQFNNPQLSARMSEEYFRFPLNGEYFQFFAHGNDIKVPIGDLQSVIELASGLALTRRELGSALTTILSIFAENGYYGDIERRCEDPNFGEVAIKTEDGGTLLGLQKNNLNGPIEVDTLVCILRGFEHSIIRMDANPKLTEDMSGGMSTENEAIGSEGLMQDYSSGKEYSTTSSSPSTLKHLNVDGYPILPNQNSTVRAIHTLRQVKIVAQKLENIHSHRNHAEVNKDYYAYTEDDSSEAEKLLQEDDDIPFAGYISRYLVFQSNSRSPGDEKRDGGQLMKDIGEGVFARQMHVGLDERLYPIVLLLDPNYKGKSTVNGIPKEARPFRSNASTHERHHHESKAKTRTQSADNLDRKGLASYAPNHPRRRPVHILEPTMGLIVSGNLAPLLRYHRRVDDEWAEGYVNVVTDSTRKQKKTPSSGDRQVRRKPISKWHSKRLSQKKRIQAALEEKRWEGLWAPTGFLYRWGKIIAEHMMQWAHGRGEIVDETIEWAMNRYDAVMGAILRPTLGQGASQFLFSSRLRRKGLQLLSEEGGAAVFSSGYYQAGTEEESDEAALENEQEDVEAIKNEDDADDYEEDESGEGAKMMAENKEENYYHHESLTSTRMRKIRGKQHRVTMWRRKRKMTKKRKSRKDEDGDEMKESIFRETFPFYFHTQRRALVTHIRSGLNHHRERSHAINRDSNQPLTPDLEIEEEQEENDSDEAIIGWKFSAVYGDSVGLITMKRIPKVLLSHHKPRNSLNNEDERTAHSRTSNIDVQQLLTVPENQIYAHTTSFSITMRLYPQHGVSLNKAVPSWYRNARVLHSWRPIRTSDAEEEKEEKGGMDDDDDGSEKNEERVTGESVYNFRLCINGEMLAESLSTDEDDEEASDDDDEVVVSAEDYHKEGLVEKEKKPLRYGREEGKQKETRGGRRRGRGDKRRKIWIDLVHPEKNSGVYIQRIDSFYDVIQRFGLAHLKIQFEVITI
eukprot:Nk52_evm9s2377 gene=Nk52_evmTU9s2377